MSKTVWYIIGILTILASILFFSDAPERFVALPPDRRPNFIMGCGLFAAVLGAIIGTCFFPRIRPVTLRILGAIGVAACVFNLIEGARSHDFYKIFINLALWLPGSIYLVVKGKLN